MLIIAHRGLLNGPDARLQNAPQQIAAALSAGYDAEIDVWLNDDRWFLGHDGPEHETDLDFISHPKLWIHCKNLAAFFELRRLNATHNYFVHESDPVVLTSKGNIWTFMGLIETKNAESICVMPEVTYKWPDIERMVIGREWYGYCTDYPERFKLLGEQLRVP